MALESNLTCFCDSALFSCTRTHKQGLEGLQEGAVQGAAAAIDKARSLLQSDKSAEGDAPPRLPVDGAPVDGAPRLPVDGARRLPVTPVTPPATSLPKHASSTAAGAAERALALQLEAEASWHAAQAYPAARAPSYGEGGDVPHLSSIVSSSPLQGPRGAGYGDATGGRGLGQGLKGGVDGGAGGGSRGLNGERVTDTVQNGWEGGRQRLVEGPRGEREMVQGPRGSIKMEDGSLLAVDPRTGRVLADSESGLQLL